MDNVDVAIDSLARVNDDSKSGVAETAEGRNEDRGGDIATSGTPQIGLTGLKRVFLAPGTLLGDTTTDLYSLREDVDLLLTTFYLFLAFMFLMFLFRR